jgi:hypothetical protein
MDVSPVLASDSALFHKKTYTKCFFTNNTVYVVCVTLNFELFRSDLTDLRAEISLANTIGQNEKAEWLNKVLILDNKTVAIDNQGPYSPQDYLNKGKTLEHSSFCSPTVTYLLAYLLTLWSRVLLEKLTGFHLVKGIPRFHGTRRFITAFTSARHLHLS